MILKHDTEAHSDEVPKMVNPASVHPSSVTSSLLTGATRGGTKDSTSFFVILPSGPVPKGVKEKCKRISCKRALLLKEVLFNRDRWGQLHS